jgi:hypothetical protein
VRIIPYLKNTKTNILLKVGKQGNWIYVYKKLPAPTLNSKICNDIFKNKLDPCYKTMPQEDTLQRLSGSYKICLDVITALPPPPLKYTCLGVETAGSFYMEIYKLLWLATLNVN